MKDNWEVKKLGEVCEIVSGNTPKGLSLISNTGSFQFYKVSDMNSVGNEIRMTKSNINLTNDELKSLKLKLYPRGTVIFPKRGGAILTNKKRILSTNSAFDLNLMGVLPNDSVDGYFLFYWFQKLDLSSIYDGSNVPQINNKNIAPLEFPIPDIETQHLIVSKIEELFSELDKGVEEIKRAKEQVKVYRQSVLKWAFEGRLTNKNVKDGELPEGWESIEIANLGEIKTGNTPSKQIPDYYGNDYPFYKPSDLDAGENVNSSIDGLTELGLQNSRVAPTYATLVTCIGATIGKTGYIKNTGGFNQQINAIIPFRGIDPKFIYYQAIGGSFQKQIQESASSTTLPILNKGKFQKLKMNKCNDSEQIRIIQEIESRFSLADQLEKELENSLLQAEALRQSILKKAFEGELV